MPYQQLKPARSKPFLYSPTALAMLLLAIVCLLSILGTVELVSELQKERRYYVQQHIKQTEEKIDHQIENQFDILSSRLRDISIAINTMASPEDFLHEIVYSYPTIRSLMIYDAQGKMIYSDLAKIFLKDLPEQDDPSKLYKTKSKDKTILNQISIGTPFVSSWNHEKLFVVKLAVRDEDQNIHRIVVALVNADLFDSIALPYLKQGWDIAILAKHTLHTYYMSPNVMEFSHIHEMARWPFAFTLQANYLHPHAALISDHVHQVNQHIHLIIFGTSVGFTFILILAAILWLERQRTLKLLQNQYRLERFDPISGTLNRTSILKQIGHLKSLHYQSGTDFSIILVDIDNFKRLCHDQGFQVGDHILAQFGELLIDAYSEPHKVGRFSGKSFMIVAAKQPNQSERKLAESLRKAIEKHPFQTPLGIRHFTVSISLHKYKVGLSTESNLQQAEMALTTAQKLGKNCVICVDE